MPLISVLMPVKQFDAYLTPAIHSILNQTHCELELLLLTYPDQQQSAATLPTDSRLRIVPREKAGIVSALNTGIDQAKGEFIARMDADDLAEPERLEQQLGHAVEHPELAMVGAKVGIFVDRGELQTGNRVYQDWLNSIESADQVRDNIYVESPLPHPTLFAKTGLFRQFRYRDCPWAEDYDLLLRLHLAGLSMGKPATPLLRWREHADRLTHQSERYSITRFLQAKACALAQEYSGRTVWICGTGRNAARLHDALVSHDVEVQGFIEHDDARQRTSRRGLPVITYTDILQRRRDELIINTVSARGVREELRRLFREHGLVERQDFVMAR